ncbi:MAG TPA: hypothetical protein VMA75_01970 [Candidatus Paceibacterota bacterium]|nr:hypothetical protein [Candidatus Paceibacterota bacterium]
MKTKNVEAMPSWAGALIEHFDAKFNLLIDGYAALDKKIDDKVDGLRAEMNERFAAVDQRFGAIEQRLDAIEARLDSIESRFEQYDAQFEVVFEELRKQ